MSSEEDLLLKQSNLIELELFCASFLKRCDEQALRRSLLKRDPSKSL